MVRLRCHSRKMDPFGNDEIARLLRLKRYEQPPPAYFENFLSRVPSASARRIASSTALAYLVRARAGFRGPVQRPFLGILRRRYRGSVRVRRSNFNHDLSATRHYSIRSPELAGSDQVTEYRERIGLRASVLIPPFDTQPAVLLPNSRNIRMLPVLPADLLRPDEFVPLKLERESLDDQATAREIRPFGKCSVGSSRDCEHFSLRGWVHVMRGSSKRGIAP